MRETVESVYLYSFPTFVHRNLPKSGPIFYPAIKRRRTWRKNSARKIDRSRGNHVSRPTKPITNRISPSPPRSNTRCVEKLDFSISNLAFPLPRLPFSAGNGGRSERKRDSVGTGFFPLDSVQTGQNTRTRRLRIRITRMACGTRTRGEERSNGGESGDTVST